MPQSAQRALAELSPALRWALGAALLLTTWALWWPQAEPMSAVAPALHVALAHPPVRQEQVLPAQVDDDAARGISPAERDPFAGTASPEQGPTGLAAATPELVNAVAPVAVAPAAPVAPTAPRYFGSMLDPQGRRVVFLQDGDRVLPVTAGTVLPSAYTVQRLGERELSLSHPLLPQPLTLVLPAQN